ncbi:hypothetical protein WJX72_009628 [[Myrmecia] bisecta]|uniref:EXS domain-containing protein n=1 Tax=[Myrmecia] bisecta TaxID=41462 RepID=A0AAW1PQR6_9CHLO
MERHKGSLLGEGLLTRGPAAAGEFRESPVHAYSSTTWPLSYGVQKPLFFVWMGVCICGIVAMLHSTVADMVELFYIYYQPLIPMLGMLWLWGINVRFFEQRCIKYDVCFSVRDQKYLLTSRQIFQAAGLLSTLVMTSAALFTYHCAYGHEKTASFHPPLVYTVMATLFLLPVNLAFKDTRLFFSSTFWRVVTPFREVSWADFLLADILTSLAKPLSDAERAMCHLTSGPVMQPHTTDQLCGSSSMIIPLGLSLPYAWRFFQCIRVYTDTGNKAQLLNALKYSTAFPVIILSSMKYQVASSDWVGFYKPLWLAAACLNSAYSYFWDIERDWEISFFSNSTGEKVCAGISKPVLRSEQQYPRLFYYYLMVSNLLLRLSWTYKLSPHLRRNHFTVLVFTLLEAGRRFQWIFVRIEVELRKLQHQKPELGQLVPALPPKDGFPAMSKLVKNHNHLETDIP